MASNNSSSIAAENCSDTIVSIREDGKLNEIDSLECQSLNINSSHVGFENELPKNKSDNSESMSKRSNESQEKISGKTKRPRTNYKDPENSAKLNAALSMLINQDGEGQIIKDIKSVAKLFGVPYNTLRDNFLRATTGQVNKLKKDVKQKIPKNIISGSITKEMVYVPLTQYPLSLQHLQSATCNSFPSKPVLNIQNLQIQCNSQPNPTYFLCKAPENMERGLLQFHPHMTTTSNGMFSPRHLSSSCIANGHSTSISGDTSLRHSYHPGN